MNYLLLSPSNNNGGEGNYEMDDVKGIGSEGGGGAYSMEYLGISDADETDKKEFEDPIEANFE